MVSHSFIIISLNGTLSSCQPVQETFSKYGPLIKNGCTIISPREVNNTAANDTITEITSVSTTSSTSIAPSPESTVPAAQNSVRVSINVSFISLFAVILIM